MPRIKKEIQLNKFVEPDLKILSETELREMWKKWHGVKTIISDAISRKDKNGDPVKLYKQRPVQFLLSKQVAGWDLDYGYAVRPGFKFMEAENLWSQYERYEHKREQAEKNEINFGQA